MAKQTYQEICQEAREQATRAEKAEAERDDIRIRADDRLKRLDKAEERVEALHHELRQAKAQALAEMREGLELAELFAEFVEQWWLEAGSLIDDGDGEFHHVEEPDEADPLCSVLNVASAIRSGNEDDLQCVLYADGAPDPDLEQLEQRLIAAGKAHLQARLSTLYQEGEDA